MPDDSNCSSSIIVVNDDDNSNSKQLQSPQYKENISFDAARQSPRNSFREWLTKIKGDIYADDDPRQYSRRKKNCIVLIVALSGVYGPIATLIYAPGISQMAQDLSGSIEAINATMAAYVALAGLTPLFWSSMGDAYGRKPVYMISSAIGIIASILCAVSKNIPMLIVFRALQASGASSGQTLGAGSIGDIFDVQERGRAYGIFFLGPLVGPSLGPLLGGFLCEFLGWRSSFYFIAILGGCVFILITFFLPETVRKRKPATDMDSSITKVSSERKSGVLKTMHSAFAPMVTMLGDPTILIMTLYGTIIYASLFFLNPTVTYTFETAYNYNSWQIGLCYLCLGAGMVVGSISSGIYSDHIIRKLRKSLGPENVYPELRLKAVYPSFFFIPAGYLIYAWTAEKQVGVYGPLIGLFVYAIGQMLAVGPSSVYYVDSKPGRSASAVAINNCFRSLVSAIVTVFSTDCVRAVGPGVLFSILAGISVVNISFVMLVKVNGCKWRTRFEKRTGTEPIVAKDAFDDSHVVEKRTDDCKETV